MIVLSVEKVRMDCIKALKWVNRYWQRSSAGMFAGKYLL